MPSTIPNQIRKVPSWLRDTLIGKWRVVLGQRLHPDDLKNQLIEGSIPSFSFYFLLALSATIATLGLLADSTATIIGAMIIAPLKSPIDTLSYGLVEGDVKLIRRALWTLSTGIVTTILVAYLLSISVGWRFAGLEILSRSNPNLLDLGVALAAGAAGSFSLTRRNLWGAPAGVAIAVALVPPLCVVGIGLGIGEPMISAHAVRVGEANLATGSGLLFFTNFFAIAFSGGLVFLVQSYSTVKRAAPRLIIAMACVVAISAPLGFSLRRIVVQNRAHAEIRQIAVDTFPDWFGKVYNLSTEVTLKNNTVFANVYITAPENPIDSEDIKLLQQSVSNKLNLPIDIDVHVLPYSSFAFHPPESTS